VGGECECLREIRTDVSGLHFLPSLVEVVEIGIERLRRIDANGRWHITFAARRIGWSDGKLPDLAFLLVRTDKGQGLVAGTE
jgi:hypothetical protein